MTGSMKRSVIVVAVLGAMCSQAAASQVHLQAMAESAGNIQTALTIKVLEVKHTRVHMKLKSGAEGPITSIHADYKCQVAGTVIGRWPADTKTVNIRFTSVVPIKYDENGKVAMRFSFMRPGSGMEPDLKKGKVYLACFAYHLDASKPLQHLYAAYRPENSAALLAAIGDAKSFAKFSKALKARLPDGWKISSTIYGKFRPLGGVGGSGIYIYIYDHKAPVVAGKRAPWTDMHIWIRDRDFKAATPKATRPTARLIGAWRGRRVLIMGGPNRWPSNRQDIAAAFKSSGYPLRPPLIEPDYKLAEKITADLSRIGDHRKRSEYTAGLLKDRKKALPALVAILERGEASVHKDSSMLLWEYAALQLNSFDDPRITSHLIARLARSGDRCNSHLFVRSLAKFKVKAAVPYLIRWLRRDGSWEIKYDMFGEEASYQLSALDRIAGTRFGPPDQIDKREFEFYQGMKRNKVMPAVEKWWKGGKKDK
ncbi:MAG: hypothetical protein QGH60_12825 [Phycisphaerae bacterium]|jgi:hypothetical protein|nr:hypothetical protein [Phycisphaerae bacterium]